MAAVIVSIDCDKIRDWETFHDTFDEAFGFPSFYGRNMNAWIDCLTSLDAADDGMSKVTCESGSMVTIQLVNVNRFKIRCREQYESLVECSAFVNWRRIEMSDAPVLALSYWMNEP